MKRFKAIALTVALSLGLVGPALSAQGEDADPQTVEELVTQVQAAYTDVTSLRADFVQVTRSATMGEQKQRGKVSLERPKKMKWDSALQGGPVFITDGQRMWLYTPAEKQVLVYDDLSQAGGAGMFDLLNGLNNLSEYFEVALDPADAAKERKNITAVLTPREADSQFKQIRLVFSKKKYEIQQITTVDAFGVETEISFTAIKLNQDIPDEEFTFEAPKGVEVINAGGI